MMSMRLLLARLRETDQTLGVSVDRGMFRLESVTFNKNGSSNVLPLSEDMQLNLFEQHLKERVKALNE